MSQDKDIITYQVNRATFSFPLFSYLVSVTFYNFPTAVDTRKGHSYNYEAMYK